MGLEAAQFLEDLSVVDPTHEDFIEQGDDHIRGVKRAAKQTFPGMIGRAWRKRSVGASGVLALNDNMTLVVASQTLTLTPSAASVLGNGWMVMVRATGGTVTIDPGQNINGAGNYGIPTGYTGIIFCDGTEFFAMLVYESIPVSVPVFPPGTKMVFNQTTAPTGWTKILSATYSDAVPRFTTGTVGTGGGDAFSSVFSSGRSTSGFTLTISHIPPHAHTLGIFDLGSDDYQSPASNIIAGGSMSTSTVGGGAAHAHDIPTMNIKYVDLIAASKD